MVETAQNEKRVMEESVPKKSVRDLISKLLRGYAIVTGT
jgi:hypothetical protein